MLRPTHHLKQRCIRQRELADRISHLCIWRKKNPGPTHQRCCLIKRKQGKRGKRSIFIPCIKSAVCLGGRVAVRHCCTIPAARWVSRPSFVCSWCVSDDQISNTSKYTHTHTHTRLFAYAYTLIAFNNHQCHVCASKQGACGAGL